MTGRTDPPAQGSSAARALLLAALGLALASTAVLVLSDSLRWMRLGVVAALWAALAGAFLAARYRRQVADRAEEAAELQHVYELELEREVAARREYELEVEATTRRKVEEETAGDLDALREELKNLRQSLEVLLGGGEVFVERFALHAEATRMRGLEGGAIAARQSNQVRHITAAGEPDTQLIGRVPRPPWTGEEEPDRIDPDWTPSWESSRQAPIPAQNRAKPGRPGPQPQRSLTPGRQDAEAAPVRREPARADVSQEIARPAARGPEVSQQVPVRQQPAAQQRGPARRPENGQDADPAARPRPAAANGARPGPEVSQEFGPVRREANGAQPRVQRGPEVSQEFGPVRREASGAARGPQVSQEFAVARREGTGAAPGSQASQEFAAASREANGAMPGSQASQQFAAVRREANGAPGAQVSQQFAAVRHDPRGPQVSQEFAAVRREPNGAAPGPQVSQQFAAVSREANGAAPGSQPSQEFTAARREPNGAAPRPNGAPQVDFAAVRPSPPDFSSARPSPQVSQEAARRQPEQYPPARLSPPEPAPKPVPAAARETAARETPPVHRPRAAERTEVAMRPAPEPGGRRRAVTGTFPPVNAQAESDTGGRRRRAEGAPTWQEAIAPEPEDTGSHTSGKSVSELLAAHGTGNAPRRHRRRGEE
ncbi:DUF6779 domain-containing protein [Actinokineospora diospyrosa]|uniref:DUF6779 domain-containing protein n=1 Tax=Actinokineospora diospyrosa TaxID=103728 RepID=A0ABT1IDQ8_9PSEU|nr:DUF6779 domain-containing protein [Actinokineospora diospyrosa]MCP2270759.1 hypothetical protein [Actinokineospora diospyrosa]